MAPTLGVHCKPRHATLTSRHRVAWLQLLDGLLMVGQADKLDVAAFVRSLGAAADRRTLPAVQAALERMDSIGTYAASTRSLLLCHEHPR